jgi:Ran GTPase-activating protein (RanGAP) involved in mRNA processing and transport
MANPFGVTAGSVVISDQVPKQLENEILASLLKNDTLHTVHLISTSPSKWILTTKLLANHPSIATLFIDMPEYYETRLDTEIEKLSDTISSSKSLHHLRINNLKLTDQSSEFICYSLGFHTVLKTLDIERSFRRGQSADLFWKLEQSTTLEHLNVSFNDFSPRDMLRLGLMLQSNKSLKTFRCDSVSRKHLAMEEAFKINASLDAVFNYDDVEQLNKEYIADMETTLKIAACSIARSQPPVGALPKQIWQRIFRWLRYPGVPQSEAILTSAWEKYHPL